jgi:hypothetical protein
VSLLWSFRLLRPVIKAHGGTFVVVVEVVVVVVLVVYCIKAPLNYRPEYRKGTNNQGS